MGLPTALGNVDFDLIFSTFPNKIFSLVNALMNLIYCLIKHFLQVLSSDETQGRKRKYGKIKN